MGFIDLNQWDRYEIFKFFKACDHPQYSVTANIEISKLYHFVKENNLSLHNSLLYIFTKCCNNVKEFRYRIRGNGVYVHDVVNVSATIPAKKNLFRFCILDYQDDFNSFMDEADKKISQRSENLMSDTGGDRDDLIFTSCLPWIHFTSLTNPYHTKIPDTFPRIVWGKFLKEGEKVVLPVSVQVHHALIDGYPIGLFFEGAEQMAREMFG